MDNQVNQPTEWFNLDESRLSDDAPDTFDTHLHLNTSQKATSQFAGKRTKNVVSIDKFRQLMMHPITLGAFAGVILGVIYLSLNPLDDVEWQNPPTHAAQLAEVNWESTSQSLSPTTKLSVAASPQLKPEEEIFEVSQSAKIPLAEQIPELTMDNTEEANKSAKPLPSLAVKASAQPSTSAEGSIEQSHRAKVFSSEEKYLLSTNNKYYTLQLMGGRNPAGIHHFIEDHKISDKAYTYRKQVDGGDWYVVLLGQYPTKEAAQQAADALPSAMSQSGKPWVRSMESVQKEIRSKRG